MTPEQIQEALDAFNRTDEVVSFIRNMMNEPDEIVGLNAPAFRADLDCTIKDLRTHGATIRTALQRLEKAEKLASDVQAIRDDVTLGCDGMTKALSRALAEWEAK